MLEIYLRDEHPKQSLFSIVIFIPPFANMLNLPHRVNSSSRGNVINARIQVFCSTLKNIFTNVTVFILLEKEFPLTKEKVSMLNKTFPF